MYTYNGSASVSSGAFTGQYETRTRPNTSSPWSSWVPSGINGVAVEHGRTTSNWSGVKLPNFEAMKRRGQLIPLTDWLKKTESWSVPESPFTANANLTQVRGNGHLAYQSAKTNFPALLTLEDCDFGALQQRLLLNAADDAYNNGHDTFTFLAEIAKTFALFASIAPRIESVFDQLESIANAGAVRSKSGKRVQTSTKLALIQALMSTPGLWLEARYGLRPLLYDVKDIAESVAELQHKFLGPIKTASADDSVPISVPSFEQTVTSGVYGSVKATTTSVVSASVRANIAARIRSQGFGGSPVITAYERAPLSFVLDWFLDLGSWLGAIHFAVMQEEHYASLGYIINQTQTTSYSRLTTTNGWTLSGGLTTSTRAVIIKQRVPTSVPLLPAFSVNLNTMKNFDIGAILFSVISGKAKLFKRLTG